MTEKVIEIPPQTNITRLLEFVGYTEQDISDPFKVFIVNNELHVMDDNITQEQLDAALAEYIKVHDTVLLDDAKLNAIAFIHHLIGEKRRDLSTNIYGQDIVYLEKAEQATDYISAGRPADASSFALLMAEAAATGLTVNDVADRIILARSQWLDTTVLLEQIRMSAKTSIDNATSSDEIQNIVDNTVNKLQEI